jgi:uncharacterized membrane protein YdbT with pleckstrin-like domain
MLAADQMRNLSHLAIGITLSIGILMFILAYRIADSTTLAITTKRIIARVGVIRINELVLNHEEIVTLKTERNYFGQRFDFGTIVIIGVGGKQFRVPLIEHPNEFVRNTNETILDWASENQSRVALQNARHRLRIQS